MEAGEARFSSERVDPEAIWPGVRSRGNSGAGKLSPKRWAPTCCRSERTPRDTAGAMICRVDSTSHHNRDSTTASGTVSLSSQSTLHHSIALLLHYRFRWQYLGWAGVQLPKSSPCTTKQDYFRGAAWSLRGGSRVCQVTPVRDCHPDSRGRHSRHDNSCGMRNTRTPMATPPEWANMSQHWGMCGVARRSAGDSGGANID